MRICRTVCLNPLQPFDDVTNFPKLLASFHSDEADFQEQNNTISPELHICCYAECSRQYEGLSFFESHTWHNPTNALDNNSLDDLITLNVGDYFLNTPPTKEKFMEISKIVTTANKKLKVDNIRKRIMAYACYEYEFTPHPNWILQTDQNLCRGCSLSPTQPLPCEFTKAKDEEYAYCPDLLLLGWTARCIKFKVVPQLPPFESSFDRELWSCCGMILKYMEHIDDFSIVGTLSKILLIARENSYSIVLFFQNKELLGPKIREVLLLLMANVDDYADTQPLSKFLCIVQHYL